MQLLYYLSLVNVRSVERGMEHNSNDTRALASCYHFSTRGDRIDAARFERFSKRSREITPCKSTQNAIIFYNKFCEGTQTPGQLLVMMLRLLRCVLCGHILHQKFK